MRLNRYFVTAKIVFLFVWGLLVFHPLNAFTQQYIPVDSLTINKYGDSVPAVKAPDTTIQTKAANTDTVRTVGINDSITIAQKKMNRHSPLKAAMFSLALPGLGQAYNKRWWKIPLVYAGFGGLGYAIYYTGVNFHGFRNAYRTQMFNPNSQNPASYKGVNDVNTLRDYRDYYKRYYDISAICTGVWYLLNIIDATVDAHLMEWNMRDDLSISWHPVVMPNVTTASSTGMGLQLTLGF